MSPLSPKLRDAAFRWMADDVDPEARTELQRLLASSMGGDEAAHRELTDRMSATLTFGTAGLRGPLRAGPNGMNRSVVVRATAGLAEWLTRQGHGGGIVVVGRDARHGSAEFAEDAAGVLASAGFDARVLPRPLPTPVLAYAVRALRAVAGVQITASHNPPQDNGYKVYLGDGTQIVPPADRQIEAAIEAAPAAISVPRGRPSGVVDDSIVQDYLAAASAVTRPAPPRALSPGTTTRTTNEPGTTTPTTNEPGTTTPTTNEPGTTTQAPGGPGAVDREGLRIAATPLHGVGGESLVAALRSAGFTDVRVVAEQAVPDPDFPTVSFPNPEEPGTVDALLALAEECSADLAVALDPDADRCALGARGRDGVWQMLRGDETGVLLAHHLLSTLDRTAHPDPLVATTIVSSSQLKAMAAAHGVRYDETLTGFKWLVRSGDGAGTGLVYAYEEALGHCVAPDSVRDKDGISAAVLGADLAAWLRATGRNLWDVLDELAIRHGVHLTEQLSVRLPEVAAGTRVMRQLRTATPTSLAGVDVEAEDLLPRSDVIVLRGAGLRVVVRPSGTEPKVKAYLEVVEPVSNGPAADGGSTESGAGTPAADPAREAGAGTAELEAARARAQGRIAALRVEVAALLG
ncbi:phosphomannomutase [Actinoalloteichus fjordicus]|uniref:Phosphomannomutase n=2 Tax=Actinoalloteichus fjordicus TaxID=1612552 RepID=A0AAC9LIN4_9PSEU|nr:phospho-sugar mutase [Actinoalloteichus fjordicus]APU17447.1 phosphomannomutase [Actinoalloteichus fjordicus]